MSNENKSQDAPIDPELDELLNSALADFDKPAQPKKDGESTKSSSNLQKKKNETISEDLMSEGAWSTDFIKQATEEFEKNLQNFMPSDGDAESFQKIAQALTNAMSSSNVGNDTEENGTNFQAAIAQTLKDLSATSESLKNTDGQISEADLAAMFGKTSLDDSAGDIFPFMQGMMQSLLSKEILYPSLKDLVDKYPAWLDEKQSSLPSADFDRYTKQLNLMQQVCSELETETEDDGEDVKKLRFDKILSLMHDMQSCGQPPDELMGEQPENLQSCSVM